MILPEESQLFKSRPLFGIKPYFDKTLTDEWKMLISRPWLKDESCYIHSVLLFLYFTLCILNQLMISSISNSRRLLSHLQTAISYRFTSNTTETFLKCQKSFHGFYTLIAVLKILMAMFSSPPPKKISKKSISIDGFFFRVVLTTSIY